VKFSKISQARYRRLWREEIFPAFVEYEIAGFPIGSFLKYRRKKEDKMGFSTSAGVVSFRRKKWSSIHAVFTICPGTPGRILGMSCRDISRRSLAVCEMPLGSIFPFTKKLPEASETIILRLTLASNLTTRFFTPRPYWTLSRCCPRMNCCHGRIACEFDCPETQMSTDEETVGGPIDVAGNSKGDGLSGSNESSILQGLNPHYGN